MTDDERKTCPAVNSVRNVPCQRADGHEGAHMNFTDVPNLNFAWDIMRGFRPKEST